MQFYDEIIDISYSGSLFDKSVWRPDSQYEGTYPEGARDKEVYFSPNNKINPFIKPDWRYLFKLPRSTNWCPWQFWVEIIAYRLGALIGVEVPPAHVGFNSRYDSGDGSTIPAYGALIEWFYAPTDTYIHGGQIMSVIIPNYDRKRGEQHNYLSIDEYFPALMPAYVSEEYLAGFGEYSRKNWAKLLVFDTLIANTDRHHDNWGVSLQPEGRFKFSPAFDNGTAMEYSVSEKDFSKYQGNKLQAHLTNPKKARHHIKWSLEDIKPLNYYDFMRKFVLEFPHTKPIIAEVLRFNRQQVDETLIPLCDIVKDSQYKLTNNRLSFIIDMIFRRKELLEKALSI